ncbi:zinc-binding dehydrogenase [Bradyrhizobium sp. U87765 SZCCT0131]|uniref:quinone oxidoreductase family protein n=1 Tax=unclassified Bradyrhizobium TaxID=2631580 RepID=UPI001BA4A0EC|nr:MULTISPECIES: zinc-binding dehydrogenase [unclassified Bradyrhizobium]MBR1219264.1 zinc-binding dehydrogenase [Bradyrhizobium sp. U87765 SZCCT0131]MBR1261915.1 zinc-binding dehydrogenase [Bradyrhizobium sp. U87765 SZCCT0134]MBR1306232.1 zinc-binding dehydrogenase [Bradyrhizobium sp. U87765 SZCCT0110]MBR1317697.1 zinc-binding dehydrogenase [Bradyrhizobium sp. U87765 SZCCT0109]MBR1351399.1 zinc-binding dehydrogenase [Bradyrhizobium sp. U87765 SZCCT0048]
MRAVQFSRFGGPEVLVAIEAPTPKPQPGEVLVRVRAAGVNFFEALMRADRYAVTPLLPMIPGVEVAGEIAALGEGVSGIAVGARVAVPLFAFGRGDGGYAEFVVVAAAAVVPLPEAVSFEAAVALLVQGLTALQLVRHAALRGRRVVVTAAAGGVGSLLLQLAKAEGAATLIGAASTADKRALAQRLGADVTVDAAAPDWDAAVRAATGGAGADVVIDMVGGDQSAIARRALAPRGELVFGAMGRFALAPADVAALLVDNQALRGFALLPLLTPQNVRADLAALFAQVAGRRLEVIIGGRFALADAAQAHRALESRGSVGKLVLMP